MSKHVIQCWSCGTRLNLDERNENDGDCIECGVELALDDYLDQAVTENDQLRAELAALKAGQGEAVAPYGYLREVDGQVQLSVGPARPADRSGGCATPWAAIFAAPPASADAVSVPRELLERAIANLALLDSRPRSMCRDCADCNGVCHTTGLDCDVSALTAGLRALLVRQGVKP